MSTCPHCGKQNRSEAQFCNHCGKPMAQTQSTSPPTETPDIGSPSQRPSVTKAFPPEDQQASPEKKKPLTPSELERSSGSRPASEVKTKPLSPPDFAPLPPGELLAARRYEVVEIINKSPKLNAYLVRDLRRRHCSKCSSVNSEADADYCSECGASFADEPVEHPGYLLKETLDRDMLAPEARIAELGLQHNGIVNIHHAFEESPYRPHTRFYVVSDPDAGDSLANLPRPQPEEQVLTWSAQLAEALAYLHRNGVHHRNIRLENIRIVDSQAKLTNFGLSEQAPRAAPKEEVVKDVVALTRTLYGLLEGEPLSENAAAVFKKALSSNQAGRHTTAEALVADLSRVLEAMRRPHSVTFLVGRRSDPGQIRELNEDSLLTLEIEQVLQSVSTPVGLYVVADGMGGHSAGEIASAKTIRVLARMILNKLMLPTVNETQADLDYAELLREASLEANRTVYEHGRQTGSDLGTTLVAALVVGSEAYIANIGDSRAYLVNEQAIKQITTDHSVVERLVATGQITKEEARTHPDRNLIYRTIGDKPKVEVDVFHQGLSQGDQLVLCSDGLTGMVEDDDIYRTVITSLTPLDACKELVRLANTAGGDDNITVIVVKIEEVSSAA